MKALNGAARVADQARSVIRQYRQLFGVLAARSIKGSAPDTVSLRLLVERAAIDPQDRAAWLMLSNVCRRVASMKSFSTRLRLAGSHARTCTCITRESSRRRMVRGYPPFALQTVLLRTTPSSPPTWKLAIPNSRCGGTTFTAGRLMYSKFGPGSGV
jgi:hypothetical protein